MAESNQGNFTPAHLQEGVVLSEEDIEKLGLTEAELQGLAEGKINPGLFNVPEGEIREQVQRALQEQAQKRLAWQSQQPRQQGQKVDFDSLPPEKQQELLDFVNKAANAEPSAPSPPSSPAPEFQFNPEAIFMDQSAEVSPEPEPEAAPANTTKDAEVGHNNTLCPHCLRDTTHSPFHPTEQDKRNFRQACVDNRPFTKQYSLFGGAIEVEFRTRPRWVAQRALEEVDQDRQSGKIPDAPSGVTLAQVQERYQSLIMTASLRWMSGWVQPMPPLNEELWQSKGLRDIHDQLFNHIGDERWRALIQCFLAFEGTVARMTEAASSENFWSGTGSAN